MTRQAYNKIEITQDMISDHGLTSEEYQTILKILGRQPNLTELGIFSVMWSEHCSYKSSRLHLKKLPVTSKRVIQGPGENAGVIDIDDDDTIIFKMESHNHPSYIEPHQGAATGVGGILRDVFTMGARPIALMNALRFGDPDHPKTQHLIQGVVSGIGHYGNCVGVPTIGGETNFDSGYNHNILVNAMCVGYAKKDRIFYSAANVVNATVLYVGAKTGRDGIHGATMASSEFDELTDEKRPTVQIGDPFTEKLLIEACLELMQKDAIIAIQDMGAAGLTSSSVEMASKGMVGIELDLDQIPKREENLSPYEIMLSESQERMLIVLKPNAQKQAFEIFEKWGLDVAKIGMTTSTGRLILKHRNEIVCDIPLDPLSEYAPQYNRPYLPIQPLEVKTVQPKESLKEALFALLSSPDLSSKRWIWEQYDRHVMTNTIDSSQTGGNAAIVRLNPNSYKAIAISCDVTPRYCLGNSYEGGKQAVAETWRNLTSVGATPIAITNCLNFGNPEKPEIMSQFVHAIEGMAEACKQLDFPVVSGNVSLYNETNGQSIPPTPAIGGIGLLKDYRLRAHPCNAQEGDYICVIGHSQNWLSASYYARYLHKQDKGAPPPVDLESEKKNGVFIRSLIQTSHLNTVHDISDGGVLIALVEMSLASDKGFELYKKEKYLNHEYLFGESQGRYMIAIKPTLLKKITKIIEENSIHHQILGRFKGENVTGLTKEPISLKEIKNAHNGWLDSYMSKTR